MSAASISLGLTLALCAASGVTPAVAQTPDTTITIHASSTALEFVPSAIVVRQGQRITLRFTNPGTLPHNLVLVKREDDIDALAAAAMEDGGDYVPTDMKDRMLAFTRLASPGQTVEVTFTAPPAGAYTYVCLMSGHAGMMLGTLRSVR